MPNEKILITGASSYVGSALFRDLSQKYEATGTFLRSPIWEHLLPLDTTNAQDVLKLIEKEKPTTIIHAAGAASLKWCLEHPEESRKINEDATRNIIEAANKIGAGVIFISSFAAIKPDNPYAIQKSNSEKMIKELAHRGVIIRPTVVIGVSPNTKNDKFMNRMLKNVTDLEPAIYDNTWQIQPTELGHLSQVISAVIDRRLNKKTIPVVTNRLATYFEIANDILPNFGITVSPVEGQFYPPEKDDTKTLEELGLPVSTYEEMIQKCIKDIGVFLSGKK